ncbi:MAG: hypothetical protein D6812_03860, partial [Deltaproteobacteria bacterium]
MRKIIFLSWLPILMIVEVGRAESVSFHPNLEVPVVIDGEGFPVSSTEHGRYGPEVAFDGSVYFIVWSDDTMEPNSGRIYGVRVTPLGEVLDPDPIVLHEGGGEEVAVAWG